MTVVLLVIVIATYLFVSSFFIRSPLGELRIRPRGRRYALWEAFYRPYALSQPRRRRRGVAPRPPGPPAPPAPP